MALNPLNSSNLEQLALNGLIIIIIVTMQLYNTGLSLNSPVF